MKIKNIISLIVFILSYYTGNTQTVSGSWKGIIDAGGNKLPLVFHIKQTNKQWEAIFDSPVQNAYGIKTGSTQIKNDSISISIPAINGSYKGKWNGTDLIDGLFQQGNFNTALVLTRSNEPVKLEAPKPTLRPQTPKAPFDYYSEEVNFTNTDKTVEFGATLTLPKNKKDFPTVILISGSGAQDRDGSMFDHKIYWVLADHLTKAGIGVLRVDDRGAGKTSLGPNPQSLTSKNFAKDVEAALQYLLTRAEINTKKIGLIGHSEGGAIAPMVAVTNKQIAFITLLAGPGIPGHEIWNYQMRRNFIRPNLANAEYAIAASLVNEMNSHFRYSTKADSIKVSMQKTYTSWKQTNPSVDENKLFTVKGIEPYFGLLSQFKPALAWLQFFMNYDPTENLSKLKIPVLALNGASDIQVKADENISGIKQALTKAKNKKFEAYILPSLNHLFQNCTSPEQTYDSIEESFSPAALQIISDWINKTNQ
ncbi:S9 family peptidase [Sediminibacterium sp.]|uniref:alpha/beta hydrolase family protein n=1 Tax=Sediminibacterium sp. TaxID=1917865 RepID=UPI0027368784|nr:alpha/beta fold hydrolase [Sediminibacterium sp.]MDP3394356.1 alpha/beta fold hydrolase [Sediminibacterium sp.]MDP3568191.1 alpha/beta fold hydrolase [Sediminibacterium sp.]